MSRQVVCPGCQATLALPDGASKARCPACRAVVTARSERQREPSRMSGNGVVIAGILGGLLLLSLAFAGVAVGLWLYLSPATSTRLTLTKPDSTRNKPTDPSAWRMPPSPFPVPIPPTDLKEVTSVKLPESANDLAVGGGGRYIVLRFPKMSKLGVFDVIDAKLTGTIPIAEDGARFAASMNKLVVYLPGAKVMQRYNLVSQQRESLKPFDPGGKVESLCMGSASDGPIYLGTEGVGGKLFDLQSFDELPLKQLGGKRGFDGTWYSASADGRSLSVRDYFYCDVLSFESGKFTKQGRTGSSFFGVLDSDGQHVFVGGGGVLTAKGTVAPDGVWGATGSQSGHISGAFIPAQDGPFYLHLHLGMKTDIPELAYKEMPEVGATVYVLGQKKRIATLKDIRPPIYGDMSPGSGVIGWHKSVHMIPRAKLVVVLNAQADQLTLHPFDPIDALEKSGVDFIIVKSASTFDAERGQLLQQFLEAKAKGNAQVTYELQSGPPGLTVSREGSLRWSVPTNFTDTEASVLLTLRTGNGFESFHRLTLRVDAASGG